MKRRTAQELADDAYLLRSWRAWHREERDAALTGPHGPLLSELLRMFENLKHMRPEQLIGFVRSIDWSAIDDATKQVVVHVLDNAIIAFRKKNGLDPFNDNLLDAPDTPSARSARSCSPHDEGAHRGEARLDEQSPQYQSGD
jgi:hypothetical protein